MKDLFKSIFARFTDAPGGVHNALYTQVGGRLHNTAAPNPPTMPCVVMSLTSNTVDQFNEKCVVQFSIFSDKPGDTEVLAAYDALVALFDNCDLSSLGVPGNYGMERCHAVLFKEDNYWQYAVEYDVWVARQ